MRKYSSCWMVAAALAGLVGPAMASVSPVRPWWVDDDIRQKLVHAIGLQGGLWQLHIEATPERCGATGRVIGWQIAVTVSKHRKGADQHYILALSTFFTASGSWVVASTWNDLINKIECIGGGGAGGNDSAGNDNGGGAGAYANISNQHYTGGNSITIAVGAAGDVSTDAGNTSVKDNTNTTTPVLAQGCQSRSGATPPTNGGTAAASTGTVKNNGGNGESTGGASAGGGGGAGGPHGAGNNGAVSAGGSGDAGSGGAGGSAGGGAGGNGTNLNDGVHGSGGGGGGGGGTGGAGGLYGAGGGSAAVGSAGAGGLGAGGVIVITWTPLAWYGNRRTMNFIEPRR